MIRLSPSLRLQCSNMKIFPNFSLQLLFFKLNPSFFIFPHSCPFLVSQSINILPGLRCPSRQAASARKPHRCSMAHPTLLSSLLAPVWLRMVLGWWPHAGSFLSNCKSPHRSSVTTACFFCGALPLFVKMGPSAYCLPLACSAAPADVSKLTVSTRSVSGNNGPRQILTQCIQVCSSSLTIRPWKLLSDYVFQPVYYRLNNFT